MTAEPEMAYVINFQEVDKNALSLVGGKNASLGEMIRAGIRVCRNHGKLSGLHHGDRDKR
jgi:hypothetical protein